MGGEKEKGHESTQMRWICVIPYLGGSIELWQCPTCKDIVKVRANDKTPYCEG